MQVQQTRRHAFAALVMLASYGFGVFSGERHDKVDLPKPLPPKIAKAWREAGASVGWIDFGTIGWLNPRCEGRFIPADESPDGKVPAFQYGLRKGIDVSPKAPLPPWKAGALEKLPDPGVPFALDLSLTAVD